MLPILAVVAVLLLLLIGGELYARLGLGLGDPPLWMADDEMEYIARPSGSYRRFGNRIVYNAHSMRSRDFQPRRSDPRELRVLVVGDSIVNGGSHTDHDDLATTILEQQLEQRMQRPVIVGNVAAGSWGPPNQLAYLRRHGTFDADVVVFVINSADYADAPTFEPLDARRPRRRPVLALQEIAQKYLPGMVRRKIKGPRVRTITEADVELCLTALAEAIDLARAGGATVIAAQHLKRSEIEGEPEIGYHELGAVLDGKGVPRIDLGPGFAAVMETGVEPFVDGNHPNAEGQRIIAAALLERLLESIAARPQAASGVSSSPGGGSSHSE